MNVIYVITTFTMCGLAYNLGTVTWWNTWFPWGILLHLITMYTMEKEKKFYFSILLNALLYITLSGYIVIYENLTIGAGALVFLNLVLLIAQLQMRLGDLDYKWALYISTILILPAGYLSYSPAIEAHAEPPMLVAGGWYKPTAQLSRELPEKQLINSDFLHMGNDGSSHNAILAAQRIDKKLILPGKTFSFNETVGERLERRGFVPGPAFITTPEGTETVDLIGGGVCKTATILNNAVEKSGFTILEKHSHSETVTYAPPGEDTAVAWPDTDYVFRNNKSRPVQIIAREENNILTIELWGL